MKNYIAIQAFERMLAGMIYGVIPTAETNEELLHYFMDATAEQVRRIMEEDGHYSLANVVDACEELAQFFGNYAD